jgi:hypothetical protein
MPLERMLRIYLVQNWFNLSDPATMCSLYDFESMRRFEGIELADDAVRGKAASLSFRHVLEHHRLRPSRSLQRSEGCWSRSACCSSPEPLSMRRSSRPHLEPRTPRRSVTPRDEGTHWNGPARQSSQAAARLPAVHKPLPLGCSCPRSAISIASIDLKSPSTELCALTCAEVPLMQQNFGRQRQVRKQYRVLRVFSV